MKLINNIQLTDTALLGLFGIINSASLSWLIYEDWDNLSCVKIRNKFFNWQTNYLTTASLIMSSMFIGRGVSRIYDYTLKKMH